MAIDRVERLLEAWSSEDLARLFSSDELRDAGDGPDRAARLAARFAAKEACLKLFPRETALGRLEAADFSVARNGYGAPHVVVSPRARAILDRNRIRAIGLSLTHDAGSAAAVAVAERAETAPPTIGALAYSLLPIRRKVVLENLRRVFGATVDEAEITRLARAFYGHVATSLLENVRAAAMPRSRLARLVRIENREASARALARGKGALYLTAHVGNWELAMVAAIASEPEFRGRFHFLRRPLFPRALDRFVRRRFERAGLGVIPKLGGLPKILERLDAGEGVVFVLDQHAGGRDGVVTDFFGHPASTFRSLAVLALSTGAPVVPAATWREPDGRHVLRFEEPLETIECADPSEAIRLNTRAYNEAIERMVLRHPEQWFWMHRRWKAVERT